MKWKLATLEELKRRKEQREKAKGVKHKPKPKPRQVEVVPVAAFNIRVLRVNPKPSDPGRRFESPFGFEYALEKRGFTRLGSGAYSTVYAKEGSEKVIKVVRREDGWFDYCKWANDNGYAGKFAPKVFSYKKFVKAKQPFSVAVVERMQHTFHHVSNRESVAVVKRVSGLAMYGNEFAVKVANDIEPGLGTFCQQVWEKWKHDLDTHDGNVMVRKDGSLCFTDPVASMGNKITITRWKSAA